MKGQITIDEVILKNKYNEKNYSELIEIAKFYKIKGRWDMRKDELINCIMQEKSKISEVKKGAIMTNKKSKEDYAKTVEPGVIVAFVYIDENQKEVVISGKIIKRIDNGVNGFKGFVVKTIKGVNIVIGYEDVLWYKTGKRWPRYIYNQLKGRSANECKKAKK